MARNIQPHHPPADRRPERNVHLVLEVRSRLRALFGGRSGLAAAEDRAEDVAETAAPSSSTAAAAPACTVGQVRKIEASEIKMDALSRVLRSSGEAARKSAASRGAARACVGFRRCRIDVVGVEAYLIVNFAFLGIAENVVGFRKSFEFLLRRLVPGINVGMVLARQLAERLADVVRRSTLFYAQNFVIVFLRGSSHECNVKLDRV